MFSVWLTGHFQVSLKDLVAFANLRKSLACDCIRTKRTTFLKMSIQSAEPHVVQLAA